MGADADCGGQGHNSLVIPHRKPEANTTTIGTWLW